MCPQCQIVVEHNGSSNKFPTVSLCLSCGRVEVEYFNQPGRTLQLVFLKCPVQVLQDAKWVAANILEIFEFRNIQNISFVCNLRETRFLLLDYANPINQASSSQKGIILTVPDGASVLSLRHQTSTCFGGNGRRKWRRSQNCEVRWWLMLNDYDPLRNENYSCHSSATAHSTLWQRLCHPHSVLVAVLLCHLKIWHAWRITSHRAANCNSWQSVYQHGPVGTQN